METGLDFLQSLLEQAKRVNWKDHPPQEPYKAHDKRLCVLPESFRGLYVILLDIRQTSQRNLGLGEPLLVQGGDTATIAIGEQVALGRGKLADDAEGIEHMFWWLVRRELPQLSGKRNLVVCNGWKIVQRNDPTGL